MAKDTYFQAVNIALLIVYAIFLPVNILLLLRQWKHQSRLWLALLTFIITRILAAIFGLVNASGSPAVWPQDAYLNLIVDGLSPLYIGTLQLLLKTRDTAQRERPRVCRLTNAVRALELLIFVGFLLLCIGYASLTNDEVASSRFTESPLAIAGAIIFTAAHILILVLLICSHLTSGNTADDQYFTLGIWLLMAVLTVRLVYLDCEILSNDAKFNPVHGDHTIFLCSALLMEFCGTIILGLLGSWRQIDRVEVSNGYELEGEDGVPPRRHQCYEHRAASASHGQTSEQDEPNQPDKTAWYSYLPSYQLYRLVRRA